MPESDGIEKLGQGGVGVVKLDMILLWSGGNFAEVIVESSNRATELEGVLQERSGSPLHETAIDGHIDVDGRLLAFGALEQQGHGIFEFVFIGIKDIAVDRIGDGLRRRIEWGRTVDGAWYR